MPGRRVRACVRLQAAPGPRSRAYYRTRTSSRGIWGHGSMRRWPTPTRVAQRIKLSGVAAMTIADNQREAAHPAAAELACRTIKTRSCGSDYCAAVHFVRGRLAAKTVT